MISQLTIVNLKPLHSNFSNMLLYIKIPMNTIHGQKRVKWIGIGLSSGSGCNHASLSWILDKVAKYRLNPFNEYTLLKCE